jgi:replication factor C subunit 1
MGDIRAFFGGSKKTDTVDLTEGDEVKVAGEDEPHAGTIDGNSKIHQLAKDVGNAVVDVTDEASLGKVHVPLIQKASPAAKTSPATKKTPAAKKTPTKGSKATPSRAKAKPSTPVAYQSPGAEEAIKRVDEAVKLLPSQEDVLASITLYEGESHFPPPDEPKNYGIKGPAPNGHPDCLFGKTFVVSGVLDSMKREEFTSFVERHGGRVTKAVSGKTTFLVVGDHVGKSKMQKAEEKGVDMITEDGVWSLVKATEGMQSGSAGGDDAEMDAMLEEERKEYAGKRADGKYEGSSLVDRAGVASARQPEAAGDQLHSPITSQVLWVDKYKPQKSTDLVGNNQMVTNLKSWLSTWDSVHLHHQLEGSSQLKKRGKALENKKAVLLSGSPGIGKTSAALIIARECGYEPIEVNASDTRSKSDSKVGKGVGGKLSNMIREMSTNRSLDFSAGRSVKDGKEKGAHRLCLIMDEVDGMSGGDRGGVADLIQTIKNSKVPIIAICNDKYSQKLKSLRNHCIELDFVKPTAQAITKRLRMICQAEGLTMNDATMNAIIQNANGGDIRLILGTLQMIRRRTTHLSYDDASKSQNTKDVEMSPFLAAQKLLENTDRYSLSDKLEFAFQDMDLVPLLVQENYLNHNPAMAMNAANRLAIIAKAAEGFSEGDIVSRSVRQYQNWNLLPASIAIGTVMPSAYAKGSREVFGLFPSETNFPRFSAWLGQNSSHNKSKRLLGELHVDMISSGNFHADRTALRMDYCGVLKAAIVAPLIRRGKDGIGESVSLMNDYALKRDDVDSLIDLTKFKTKAHWGEDVYKRVETAVKTAFTRTFNSQLGRAKNGAVLKDQKASAKKRKASAMDDGELNLDDGVMDDDEDESEDVGVEGVEALKGKLGKKGVVLELKNQPRGKGKKATAAARAKKKAK